MAAWRPRTHGKPRGSNGRLHLRHRLIISKKAQLLLKKPTLMPKPVEHQFDNMYQQRDAAYSGMWVFLSTEVLFFGGVFFAYVIYRGMYYEAFVEGSRKLSVAMGGLNTAVLLCSSLFMAMAVHAAQQGRSRNIVLYLVITELIGATFLGIKFFEYYKHYEEHLVPGLNFTYQGNSASEVELFMVFYFVLTGMHAVQIG